MRQIDLQEHAKSDPLQLSSTERDGLQRQKEILGTTVFDIEPVLGEDDQYHLTPGSIVGAFRLDDLVVSIRPKLAVSRVLFLAAYAMGNFNLRDKDALDFENAESLVEALALALTSAADRAFARGLLQGYRTEAEALYTVRGRLRIEEQIRRRFGAPVPIEVHYDDFTVDIVANRLVKAAVFLLRRTRIRDPRTRAGLARTWARLDNVRLEEFSPNRLPEVMFDRLNEHYRQVVALSRLVLRHTSYEASRGPVQAPGFFIDMNVVFQDFLTRALQEKFGVSERTLRSEVRATTLDENGQVGLKPDLSWWEDGRCTFVGDAKYKRIVDERVPNSDLYQLLAYATALDLPGGLLVYAKGEREPVEHLVRHSGMRLEIAAMDLAGTIDELLRQVADIADRIRRLRREGRGRTARMRERSAA